MLRDANDVWSEGMLSKQSRHGIVRGLALALALFGAACGGSKPAGECTKSEEVRVTFDTHTELNHDRDGFSRSVVVRVYQLEDVAGFEQAPFDALWEGGKIEGAVAGPDEFTLIPGRKQGQVVKRRKKAVQLGIAANFREQGDDTSWKTIVQLPPAQDPCASDEELTPFALTLSLSNFAMSVR